MLVSELSVPCSPVPLGRSSLRPAPGAGPATGRSGFRGSTLRWTRGSPLPREQAQCLAEAALSDLTCLSATNPSELRIPV